MRSAFDFAKYFIQNGNDENTFDGNMKLQKLLSFANLISYAKTEKPLFQEPMLAYDNGCVVEPIRARYCYDYDALVSQSRAFNPSFSKEEYDILRATLALFGSLSARELSDIQHDFDFWASANQRPGQIVTEDDIKPELWRIQSVLEAQAESERQCLKSERINGVTYHYEPGFQFTDELVQWLYGFAETADDDSYTIYYDDGKLVIY